MYIYHECFKVGAGKYHVLYRKHHNIRFGKKLVYCSLSKTVTGKRSVAGLLQAVHINSMFRLKQSWCPSCTTCSCLSCWIWEFWQHSSLASLWLAVRLRHMPALPLTQMSFRLWDHLGRWLRGRTTMIPFGVRTFYTERWGRLKAQHSHLEKAPV